MMQALNEPDTIKILGGVSNEDEAAEAKFQAYCTKVDPENNLLTQALKVKLKNGAPCYIMCCSNCPLETLHNSP